MTPPADARKRVVFLLDVDNTLLDNDPDVTIERIRDLLDYDLPALLQASRTEVRARRSDDVRP